MDTGRLVTRLAEAGDGEPLASLAGQLGYPMQSSDMERQLSSLAKEEGHAVFVAESGAHCIVGWIHMMPHRLLYAPHLAEIGGLVVDAEYRRQGIGRALICRAEQWARDYGYSRIVVRSNVTRNEPHTFYPSLGYCRVKTQRVYMKELNSQQ